MDEGPDDANPKPPVSSRDRYLECRQWIYKKYVPFYCFQVRKDLNNIKILDI